MRVLVTGASGFAGGYVAHKLASIGVQVFALTRKGEISPPNHLELDIGALARLSIIKADLTKEPKLPTVDFIVHTAATSIWPGISVNQMLADNVIATQRVVDHALDTDARGMIFFSSLSTLGDITAPIVSEATPCINPDAYGLTKLLGERLLADVANRLPSLSIRLPAVVGPGSKRNWLSECVRKLKADEPLTYMNPEAQFNNACHIADLTQMIVHWLSDPKDGAHLVVVGARGTLIVKDVVGRLAKAFDTKSNILVKGGELRTFLIDSSHAQKNFKYTPMSLTDLLIQFIKDNR